MVGATASATLPRVIDRLRTAVLVVLLAFLNVDCNGSAESRATPSADSGSGGLFFRGLSGLTADCGTHALADAGTDAARETDGGGATCIASRPVIFSRDVKPIFRNCSGEVCHADTWGSDDPLPYLVGARATECCDGRLRVKPGDPTRSYVVQKLEGRNLCGGAKMPLGRELPDTDIQTISDWICVGAPAD